MRRILPLAFLLLLTSITQAQLFSVYGTFSPVHVSGAINGGASPNYSTTSYWAPGVGGGITFGVLPLGPIRLGFDLRGSTKPGSNGSDLILAGPKIAFKLPLIALKPYLQASGGYFATRTTTISGVPPAPPPPTTSPPTRSSAASTTASCPSSISASSRSAAARATATPAPASTAATPSASSPSTPAWYCIFRKALNKSRFVKGTALAVP